MELALYVALVFTAVAFCYRREPVTNTAAFRFLVLFGFFLFSLSVRSMAFDADIKTYAQRMTETRLSLYYLREPIVWFGQRVLFAATHSQVGTFVICDVLCFAIVSRAFKRLGLPQYALIAFVAFFPFVMGMQNIYRQWVSSCLAIYAMSLADRHLGRSFLVFLLSVLSHNVAALFFPVVFSRASASTRLVAMILGTILVPCVFLWGADTKSSTATGQNLEQIYLVLVALFLFATLSLRKLSWSTWTISSCIFSLYTTAWAAMTLSSAGAERVALFALMLLYPALASALEDNFSEKALPRIALTLLGFIPMLGFGVRVFIV